MNMHALLVSMDIAASFCVTVVPMHLVTLQLAAASVLQVIKDSAVIENVIQANLGLIVITNVTVTETHHVTLSVAGVCVHLGKWDLAVI